MRTQGEERVQDTTRTGGEAHGLVDQARVKDDIGVQLATDKVLVGQRLALELDGHFDERLLAHHLKHLVRGSSDDLGAGIVVVIDAVAKACSSAFVSWVAYTRE